MLERMQFFLLAKSRMFVGTYQPVRLGMEFKMLDAKKLFSGDTLLSAVAADHSPPLSRRLPSTSGETTRFPVSKALRWTAVAAVALAVVVCCPKEDVLGLIVTFSLLSIYSVLVGSFQSVLRASEEFDILFPTNMNVICIVSLCMLRYSQSIGVMDLGLVFCAGIFFMVVGLVYAAVLVNRQIQRVKCGDYSFSFLVYHAGSWSWWMAFWSICSLGGASSQLQSTWFLS